MGGCLGMPLGHRNLVENASRDGCLEGEDAGGGTCIVGGWGLGAAGLQGSWDSPTAPLSPPYPSWDPTCPPGCSSSPGACCTALHGTASA